MFVCWSSVILVVTVMVMLTVSILVVLNEYSDVLNFVVFLVSNFPMAGSLRFLSDILYIFVKLTNISTVNIREYRKKYGKEKKIILMSGGEEED